MSVSSIGPFQNAPIRDLSDLDLVEGEISKASQATAGVEPESAPDDSTADQENRGFVHLAEYIEEFERKKAQGRRKKRSQGLTRERLVFKYNELDDLEQALEDKGHLMNKAV